ncbi:hypothetical protein CDAR_63981 [Caerostris darwini]|uniref:Uncharacterized protein n=1 Tax=Caerostris darwini TaxID=1538125 RepID=A0AAV4PIF7_9ARAC|nr:hypothetical protein CDAR_63981 [Caerostris darwini]
MAYLLMFRFGKGRFSADLQFVIRGRWECWCRSNIWDPDYVGGCCLIHSDRDNWQIYAAIRIESLLKETNGLPRADKHPLNKKQNFGYRTFRNNQRTNPNGTTCGHLITLSSLVQQNVKMRLVCVGVRNIGGCDPSWATDAIQEGPLITAVHSSPAR